MILMESETELFFRYKTVGKICGWSCTGMGRVLGKLFKQSVWGTGHKSKFFRALELFSFVL